MELQGRHVIVTGASSGIGRGIAERMARKGAEVIAAARSSAPEKFHSPRIIPMSADLRRPEDVDRLLHAAAGRWGSVDIFVADAGFGYYGKTGADWRRTEDIFKLNVFSPVYALTRMCELFPRRPFHFVAVDSVAGRMPLPGYALYCATKFALDGFLRTFRYEMPAGVRLSVVYPAGVDTPFYEKAAPDAPVPRPVRPLGATVRHIVKGIEEEKEEIYPSAVFPMLMAVNRFCPFVETAYLESCKKQLGDWLRTHEDGRGGTA